jgi:hypothetical protein
MGFEIGASIKVPIMKKILRLMLFAFFGFTSAYAQSSSMYYPGSYYWQDYNNNNYQYNYRNDNRYSQWPNQRQDYYNYDRNRHHDNYQRHDGCGGSGNGYSGGNSYRNMPMSDQNFRTAMNYINSLNFDSEKLTQAKQIMRNNIMTSAQVKELVGSLTFDSNRLELAKAAFPSVYDKGMYFIVGEAFTFSSSRDKLNEYLLTQGY